MAVVNELSSILTAQNAGSGLISSTYLGSRLNVAQVSHDITTGDSDTSTYDLLLLPTSAKIVDGFLQAVAAITDAGTLTMDVGIKHLDGTSLTADPDIILDGADIKTGGRFNFFTEGSGTATLANISTKEIWELLGASSDPGGLAVIYATLNGDAGTGGLIRCVAQWVGNGA